MRPPLGALPEAGAADGEVLTVSAGVVLPADCPVRVATPLGAEEPVVVAAGVVVEVVIALDVVRAGDVVGGAGGGGG